jgi:hypothetical protein
VDRHTATNRGSRAAADRRTGILTAPDPAVLTNRLSLGLVEPRRLRDYADVAISHFLGASRAISLNLDPSTRVNPPGVKPTCQAQELD